MADPAAEAAVAGVVARAPSELMDGPRWGVAQWGGVLWAVERGFKGRWGIEGVSYRALTTWIASSSKYWWNVLGVL